MKSFSIALFIVLALAGSGCGKKSVDVPKEEAKTFPPPTWKQDETGKYGASMTAVVVLPSTLAQNVSANDKLAAFVNDECRGVAEVIKVADSNLFFVLIQGGSSEQSKVVFKYYNATTSYMYQSTGDLTFLIDAVYGTSQNPKTLELVQMK